MVSVPPSSTTSLLPYNFLSTTDITQLPMVQLGSDVMAGGVGLVGTMVNLVDQLWIFQEWGHVGAQQT